MKRILFVIFGLLFIVGCTTTCPVTNCPKCSCPTTTSTASYAKDYVSVYFIDVGQGDATLIKYNNTEMLIDCGKATQGLNVVQFLKDKGVTTLEYLVLTHPDADHVGGCYDVLNKFTVNNVIHNGQTADTIVYKDVATAMSTVPQIMAKQGLSYNIGPATASIIQVGTDMSQDTNINSIIIKLVDGKESVLLTADCDKECEAMLVNKDINSTILKVPHHGTKFGSTIGFLEKVNPQVAVISVGANSYGHPAPETLDRLSQQGIVVYRTDVDQDIQVSIDSTSYIVS